jgi:hypothetical protein
MDDEQSVNGDGEGDEREMFLNKATGKMQPLRGKRKKARRGPYSAEEAAMIEGFRRLVVDERYMDGRVAQQTCRRITALHARIRAIMQKYSYENLNGVLPENLDIVFEELDWKPYDDTTPEPDVDVYADMEMKYDEEDLM